MKSTNGRYSFLQAVPQITRYGIITSHNRQKEEISKVKKYTQEDIQSTIELIEKGTFNRKDIKTLFIDLRPLLQEGDLIKDLAHFIAHPDGRNKGITFKYLQTFVDDFINAAEKGGQFTSKPMFPQKKTIDKLIQDLTDLGFSVNKTLFIAQSTKIMQSIFEIIQDTPINLNNNKVREAKIAGSYEEEKRVSLTFVFYLQNVQPGPLTMYPNVGIAIPLLEIEKE